MGNKIKVPESLKQALNKVDSIHPLSIAADVLAWQAANPPTLDEQALLELWGCHQLVGRAFDVESQRIFSAFLSHCYLAKEKELPANAQAILDSLHKGMDITCGQMREKLKEMYAIGLRAGKGEQ